MKPLARITLFLRHLSAHDSSFNKARTAAESALLTAINANWLTSSDVEDLAALLEPDIARMSLTELATEVRDSISAILVRLVGRGPATYEFFNAILKQMPNEH
jgi:hypothetical protein